MQTGRRMRKLWSTKMLHTVLMQGVRAVNTRSLLSLAAATAVCANSVMVWAESLGNWPQWRGPQLNGVAPAADPPVKWSETSNIRWKVRIPGEGSGTPVIWGDQ